MFNKKSHSNPKPKDNKKKLGLSQGAYKALNILLPVVLLLLIKAGLIELSIIVAMFSKWRVFAVKPRHLWANLRSNSVDIIVKLSTLSFIIESNDSIVTQIVWTLWYIVWLTFIKPGSKTSLITAQAATAQFLGISALMYYSNTLPSILTLAGSLIIGASSARHFLSAYEEKQASLIAGIWGLFVLQMSWVLYKWTLVYIFVPQLVFILVIVSYAVGSIYHQIKVDKLKRSFIAQQSFVVTLLLVALIIIGDWKGEI